MIRKIRFVSKSEALLTGSPLSASEISHHRVRLSAIFVVGNLLMLTLCNWEQLAYKRGLAWDSGIYYRMIQHGLPRLFQHVISGYYIQRILPGLIIDIAFKVLHIAAIPANVLLGYTVLDWLCLNIAAIFICKIIRLLKAGGQSILAGAGLFFCNVFVLKCALYMPVSTDSVSLMLGAAMLWAHFAKRSFLLLFLALMGAFTHPLMLLLGAVLFAFPYCRESAATPPEILNGVRRGWAVLPVVIVLALQLLYHSAVTAQSSNLPHPVTPVMLSLYPLSLGLMLAYVGVVAAFWLKAGFVGDVLKSFSWQRGLGAALIVLACKFWQHGMASNEPVALDTGHYLLNVAQQSVTFPLGFLAAHINFFGLGILLLFLQFPRAKALAKQLGGGFQLCLLAALMLSLSSESRQMTFLFPVLLLPAALALGTVRLKAWLWAIIALAGILLARPWYRINVAPFSGTPQAFPDQRLFINYGPWMTFSSYLILLITTVAAGLALALCLRKSRTL